MSSLIDPSEIAFENNIVWLEDTDGLDYVRQHLDRIPWRTKRPAFHRDGRMVGYAVLGSKARASRVSGTFLRRVFWLAPHDRDGQPEGIYATGAPGEAVDPSTLAPRVTGHKTERSQGGPASAAMRELGITLPRT
ncbi:hypothetical protein GCM10010329_81950 [Streptomyces spiroverticillatus]|uniref:Transcription factor n=1 Tax=Streptomyces finlayi TaxID=67296 RepID=A0A918X9U6_9ACTN|nr:DUF6009 family protein [Streptomyces finlayi]GHA46967.1 hypothetical protein GCM10010329_81950 [Streptomyces spiroverticillatus]GHD18306.1 hypothetical protein GCM10010334_81030 [Streptomyces finlayi]